MGRSVTTRHSLFAPLIAALVALLVLSGAASSAVAATNTSGNAVEGVWSFSGGAVAIVGLSNGTFQGTVVDPTNFSICEHPAGQVMWTGMREQADGSFWGLHTWFKGGDKCEINPLSGLTAWRVLLAPDGTRHLEVCFSIPGDDSQPKIEPDGKCTGGTFGPPFESSPLAPLPSVVSDNPLSFEKVVQLPSNSSCLQRKALTLKLKPPKYDPLKEVVIKINGKKVRVIVGTEKLKKNIVLTKLPEGTFKVSIVATTVLSERLKGSKTYKSCGKSSGKIRLPGAKSHSPH